jgi:CBS domain-containing protein
MKANEIMTRPVVTASVGTAVREVAALLAQHQVTALPVVDDNGALVGIVSEGDILVNRVAPDPRNHLRRDAGHADPAHLVDDVMTTTVVAMGPTADVADIADLMLSYDVRSVPIVDGPHVVGIISRRDLLRALLRDDSAVAAEVRTRLDAYSGHQDRWHIQVTDGVVTVTGHFDDDTERQVVTNLAGTVAGVTNVHAGHHLAQPAG